MCELFGISANRAVSPVNLLSSFYRRGEVNPDGVGVAYYAREKKAVLRKQARMAMDSPLAAAVLESPETVSNIFIAHVRLASFGLNVSYNNTHPFGNELGGRDYIFAHNGSLWGSRKFTLGVSRPRGQTDSEYAFCYILSEISKNIKLWDNSSFNLLHSLIKDINREGTFNMMMSDGEHLFCYQDRRSHNGGLVYIERRSKVIDELRSVDNSTSVGGFIVSTKPLTKERVANFDQGELKVFKEGLMIYSSSNNGGRDDAV